MESILSQDTTLFLLINSHNGQFLDMLFRLITQLGNGYVAGPLLLLVVLIKVPKQKLAPVIAVGALAMILSGLINTTVKSTVKRTRPVAYFAWVDSKTKVLRNDSSAVIGPAPTHAIHTVGHKLRARSFPSGHTATSFAAATVLTFMVSAAFWWTYLIAGLVGYSRVYVGAHFPLDVAVAAVEGTVVVMAVYVFMRRYLRGRAAAASPPASTNNNSETA